MNVAFGVPSTRREDQSIPEACSVQIAVQLAIVGMRFPLSWSP
ncbi:MAG: hypothetical protein ABSB33_11005 [Tepidisphaeraceae bacterium]